MGDAYARAVLRVFVSLYEKGLIYRDNYMVNWDPGTRSAISDLEVEQRRVDDKLYSIDYPLVLMGMFMLFLAGSSTWILFLGAAMTFVGLLAFFHPR